MHQNNQKSGNIQERDISSLFHEYSKYKTVFAISAILCLISVFLFIRYFAVTQYEIASTILVKDKNAGQGALQGQTIKDLGLLKTAHNVENEMGILRSTGVMEKVVAKRSLNINFYVEGSIRDVEIYGKEVPVQVLADETAMGIIYDEPIYIELLGNNKYKLSTTVNNEDYQAEYTFGDLVEESFGTFTITEKIGSKYSDSNKPLYFVIRNTDKVIDAFLDNLTVELESKAGDLLSIKFLSSHKKKGEDVVSGLIETYVEEMIKYENELAENTIKMIDDRLKLLSGEISGVEKTVEEFKTKNDLTDVSSNANIYIEQANDYKKKIADYQTQLNIMKSIETYLMNGDPDSPIPGALSASEPSLVNIIDRYNETLLEKKKLSQSASSGNPLIINLDRTLNDLSQAILENVRSTRNGLMIAQRNLQANANKYDAQIAKVPAMERKLLDISRQQTTKEGLYLYLLQKREEEVLSLAAPVSSTRIVSLPKAERNPVKPNKLALYLGGLLLGFFLPFSIIYTRELLNNKVTSLEALSRLTTTPILGEIAKSKDDEIIVTAKGKRTPTAELFRLLRFNLEYLKKTDKNQVLMVTSTIKGEGKTFIATNLAASLASSGEKVVALSFDLREPALMKNFDLPETRGITEFILNNEVSVNEILIAHPTINNLCLIGSGLAVNHAGALMLSERIAVLITDLKRKFDRIIIDTAPIGRVSDAFALNPYVDSTIYIVRQNISKKEYLRTLGNIHQNGKLKNTMILLNGTTSGEPYGYGDNDDKVSLWSSWDHFASEMLKATKIIALKTAKTTKAITRKSVEVMKVFITKAKKIVKTTKKV